MPDMPRPEMLRATGKRCWGDGLDPEHLVVRKFCKWCHGGQPKHNEGCPVPLAVAAAKVWEDLEIQFAEEVKWDNNRWDKLQGEFEAKCIEIQTLREQMESRLASLPGGSWAGAWEVVRRMREYSQTVETERDEARQKLETAAWKYGRVVSENITLRKRLEERKVNTYSEFPVQIVTDGKKLVSACLYTEGAYRYGIAVRHEGDEFDWERGLVIALFKAIARPTPGHRVYKIYNMLLGDDWSSKTGLTHRYIEPWAWPILSVWAARTASMLTRHDPIWGRGLFQDVVVNDPRRSEIPGLLDRYAGLCIESLRKEGLLNQLHTRG